jgi:hypothetical protein
MLLSVPKPRLDTPNMTSGYCHRLTMCAVA